jgi:hypothetical protein
VQCLSLNWNDLILCSLCIADGIGKDFTNVQFQFINVKNKIYPLDISHLVGITDTEDNGYQIRIFLRSVETLPGASKGSWLFQSRRTFAYELISHLSPFRPESGPLASADMSHQTRGSTAHTARSGASENLPSAPVSNCRTVPQTLLSLGGIYCKHAILCQDKDVLPTKDLPETYPLLVDSESDLTREQLRIMHPPPQCQLGIPPYSSIHNLVFRSSEGCGVSRPLFSIDCIRIRKAYSLTLPAQLYFLG